MDLGVGVRVAGGGLAAAVQVGGTRVNVGGGVVAVGPVVAVGGAFVFVGNGGGVQYTAV
jgi:hypothetical protein